MPETLLSGTSVWIFGREMTDLVLKDGVKQPSNSRGASGLLAEAMQADDARLARIYAFAYQGEFVEMVRPAIFLVHGAGDAPSAKKLADIGLSVMPATLTSDMSFWKYDRDDMTLRLDMMTGAFGRILIEHEIGRDGLQDFVRGGQQAGSPSSLTPRPRGRGRRWRADDDD